MFLHPTGSLGKLTLTFIIWIAFYLANGFEFGFFIKPLWFQSLNVSRNNRSC